MSEWLKCACRLQQVFFQPVCRSSQNAFEVRTVRSLVVTFSFSTAACCKVSSGLKWLHSAFMGSWEQIRRAPISAKMIDKICKYLGHKILEIYSVSSSIGTRAIPQLVKLILEGKFVNRAGLWSLKQGFLYNCKFAAVERCERQRWNEKVKPTCFSKWKQGGWEMH